jgi:hypothetical protein
VPNVIYGQVSVTTTRARLTTIRYEQPLYVIKAASSNAGPVYIGDSAVTVSNGHLLLPGEDIDLQNTMLIGTARLDIRPDEVWVVGAGGVVSFFGAYIS